MRCCVDGCRDVKALEARGTEDASTDESDSIDGKRVSKLTSPSGIDEEVSGVLRMVDAGDVVFGALKDVGNWVKEEGEEACFC